MTNIDWDGSIGIDAFIYLLKHDWNFEFWLVLYVLHTVYTYMYIMYDSVLILTSELNLQLFCQHIVFVFLISSKQ